MIPGFTAEAALVLPDDLFVVNYPITEIQPTRPLGSTACNPPGSTTYRTHPPQKWPFTTTGAIGPQAQLEESR